MSTESTEDVARLHAWIEAHRGELVETLRGVLRIPSLKQAPDGNDAPYGRPVREALDYTLHLCREMGFRVKDVGGHAGHAEFGEGEEMVAAIGHLDVVPEGDRWRHPPFGAEIVDGYIYARGAADDKGPTYAALFAARALKECGLPLRRRVRMIFGCDEESGFGCVHHYWEVAGEERPVLGFTPDAGFPLVYAEKGIASLVLERELPESQAGLRLVSASGGRRTNMVPDAAEAQLVGNPAALYGALTTLQRYWDRNVGVEADPEGIRVRAIGKSAHGSGPRSGDNAVARLARALLTLDLPDDRAWLDWIGRSVDPDGAGLGIRGEDEVAGPLTNNLGIMQIEGAADGAARIIRLTYNIRYPVTWKIDDLLSRCRPIVEEAGWKLARYHDSPSLYVPLDQEPVYTLLRVYQEETGDTESKPRTMGGGTYARSTPHMVAFGAGLPGSSDGPAHEPDERIAIDTLIKAARIYAHAFYALAR